MHFSTPVGVGKRYCVKRGRFRADFGKSRSALVVQPCWIGVFSQTTMDKIVA